MKERFLHHHLGIGDHLLCNGLVRVLLDRWKVDKLGLFCKAMNEDHIRFLYRDEPRINIIPVELPRDNPTDEIEKIDSFVGGVKSGKDWLNGEDSTFYRLGFDVYRKMRVACNGRLSFDQIFYQQAQVPYRHRFDRFYVQRDAESEQVTYNRISDSINI